MLLLPLGFYPFDYRPEITSAIWTALPLLLLGYWTRMSATRPLAAVLAWVGFAAIGLLAIPPLTGAAGQGWEAAMACAVAVLAVPERASLVPNGRTSGITARSRETAPPEAAG